MEAIADGELGISDFHIFWKDRKLSQHVTKGGSLDIDDDMDQILMCVYKDQNKYRWWCTYTT